MLDVELAALDGWATRGVVPADAVDRIRARAAPPTPRAGRRARAHDEPRRRRVRRRSRGDARRGRAVVSLRADVLGRPRHGAIDRRPGGRRADPRRSRSRVPSGRRARGGASRDALHGAHARRPRRADDVRPEARRLGVRTRAGPRSASSTQSRASASASSPAPSASTRPSTPRSSASRASASDSSPRRARRRSSSATGTPSSSRPSRSSRRRSIASRSRSATSRAPRCARSKSRSGAGRRARLRCPTSGTRSSPSASAVSRASSGRTRSSGLENVALWHERDISHSSAERVVIPDSFLALDYLLDRFAWLVEGLVVRPEPHAGEPRSEPRRSSSANASCSRSSRAALRATLRTRSCSDMRCAPGTRSSTSASSSAEMRRSAGASTSTACSRSRRTRRTSTPSSSGSERSSRRARQASMPDGAHLASGKVRELYALDDERLLLVASDRISTFDVVLPTEIPDKGRVLTGLSAFWFARTRGHRAEPLPRASRRRPLARVPAARDASGRDRRPRLPRRLGLDRLPRDGRGLGPRPPLRPPGVGATCRSRSSRRRRRRPRDTTSTSARPRRPRSAARTTTRRRARQRSPSTRPPPSTRSERGILLADTKFEFGLDGDRRRDARRRGADAGLVPLLAGVGLRARQTPAVVRQAVRPRLVPRYGLGPDGRPARSSRVDVVEGTRARYVDAFERLTGIAFDDYLADPGVVAVKLTVLIRPKAGHPRPAGRGGPGVARHARLRRVQRSRRPARRPRARDRAIRRRHARSRSSACAPSCSPTR